MKPWIENGMAVNTSNEWNPLLSSAARLQVEKATQDQGEVRKKSYTELLRPDLNVSLKL